jgi:hypothetical protein
METMDPKYDIKNTDSQIYIFFRPTEEKYHLNDIKLLLENDNQFNIYPKSDEENPNASYENITNTIHGMRKNSGFMCDGISSDYILGSFDIVDAIVVIGSPMNILPNGNIFGFASINFMERSNSIYVDVLCSHKGIKGAGGILMNALETISKKLLFTRIYLKSVKSAIPFYEKYGFKKYNESCINMCLMIKMINNSNGGKRKRKGKIRKSNSIKRQTRKRNERKGRSRKRRGQTRK